MDDEEEEETADVVFPELVLVLLEVEVELVLARVAAYKPTPATTKITTTITTIIALDIAYLFCSFMEPVLLCD